MNNINTQQYIYIFFKLFQVLLNQQDETVSLLNARANHIRFILLKLHD